jgi:hypothetical protein
MIYKRIEALCQSYETGTPVMPPTIIYNEGWMLRLMVDRFASLELRNEPHPLAVPQGCRWYSEALLPSAFRPRLRGDPSGESWTHVDGAIGHFDIGNGGKGNLTIKSDATHFVVLEAKMFSKLSAGVKNAPGYNQVARNIACIAEALKRAGRRVNEIKTLGFYVLAPKSQIKQKLFDGLLDKEYLLKTVKRRVIEYRGISDDWLTESFLPVLKGLDIRIIRWEEVLKFLKGRDPVASQLEDFYKRCLEFNKPRERSL